jgi:hypothetical protein
MLVVVDSNLLFGSLTASRPAQEWQRLLELSSEGSIELVLPEVVHWELVNQLRENLTRKAERYRKLGDDLRRAGLAPSNSGAFEGQLSEVVADTGEDSARPSSCIVVGSRRCQTWGQRNSYGAHSSANRRSTPRIAACATR